MRLGPQVLPDEPGWLTLPGWPVGCLAGQAGVLAGQEGSALSRACRERIPQCQYPSWKRMGLGLGRLGRAWGPSPDQSVCNPQPRVPVRLSVRPSVCQSVCNTQPRVPVHVSVPE